MKLTSNFDIVTSHTRLTKIIFFYRLFFIFYYCILYFISFSCFIKFDFCQFWLYFLFKVCVESSSSCYCLKIFIIKYYFKYYVNVLIKYLLTYIFWIKIRSENFLFNWGIELGVFNVNVALVTHFSNATNKYKNLKA